MTPYISLVAGIVGLSLCVTYIYWMVFRVWVLRQDLFAIRDELFDVAAKQGFLDEPHYRTTRAHLNALIRFAPKINIATWIALRDVAPVRPIASNRIPEVDAALNTAASRVVSYVYLRTLGGVMRLLWSMVAMHVAPRQQVKVERPAAKRVLNSPALKRIDEMCVA